MAEGVEPIWQSIEKLNEEMIDALPHASRAGAQILERGIKRNAPRITGELQEKISVAAGEQVRGDGWGRSDYEVRLGADYSRQVERGHPVRNRPGGDVIGRAAPVRFAARAMRSRRGAISTAIRTTLMDAVDIPSINVESNVYLGGRD